MSQKICGMNLDEYIQFHCEFVGLFRAISDGDATDDDIIPFLEKHGQKPVFAPDDPEEIDPEYYMGAGLKPWEDVIIKDPDMQSKKAMGLIQWQNRGTHGDSTDSADIKIEGLSLDAYAHICAVTAAGGDINSLYEQYGIKDQDHFNKINAAYQSAMSTDATGMLATHYGDFYMKHSPQHAANVNQAVGEAMAASTADLQAKEKRDVEVNKKLKEMAIAGNRTRWRCDRMATYPSLSIIPQLGMGGLTPKPMKLRNAS